MMSMMMGDDVDDNDHNDRHNDDTNVEQWYTVSAIDDDNDVVFVYNMHQVVLLHYIWKPRIS